MEIVNIQNLKTQKKKLEAKLNILISDRDLSNIQISFLQEEIQELNKIIQNTKEKKIIITEHAIVRYFERVQGYDIEEIKQLICTEELQKNIKTLGDGKYPVNKFNVVVKNNTIITVE